MLFVRPKLKMVFFNRDIIRHKWKEINDSPLKRAGLLVRKIARGSIHPRKNRNIKSPPGTPPYSHDPRKTFKLIFSLPDRFSTSVIIGMVKVNDRSIPVPGLHEHGGLGITSVIDNSVRGIRAFRRTRKRVLARRTVRYPERPFMRPALTIARSKLPAFWQHSLR